MADDPLVVIVILRPASGRRITGDSTITSATLHDYEPSATDTAAVIDAFSTAGFDAGPLVGVSFAVTGPQRLVERFFATRVVSNETEGAFAVTSSGERSRELPLDAIQPDIADRIEAAVFDEPQELTC